MKNPPRLSVMALPMSRVYSRSLTLTPGTPSLVASSRTRPLTACAEVLEGRRPMARRRRRVVRKGGKAGPRGRSPVPDLEIT
jgi:hypothetical protein